MAQIIEFLKAVPTVAFIERNEAIATIKAALKLRSKTRYSVIGGRGTSWGWIEVNIMSAVYKQGEEIVRAELQKLNALFGFTGSQPISIPSSSAHRREYIERAKGLPVTKIAEAYWD